MKQITHFKMPNFREQLRLHYINALEIGAVLLAIAIVYGNDLAILANEALNSESYSHVLFLPFFAAFLFYLKKDSVKASVALEKTQKHQTQRYINQVLGIILVLTAFIVYWYGSNTFYPLEYHILSLPIFLAGTILILLNPRALRALIFPILFLLFLVPIPTTTLYTIGGVMANVNTQIAYNILHAANLPITLSTANGAPTILLSVAAGTPTSFTVDVPCSGIYSLIAFAMFSAFFAFVAQTSVFKKILVFFAGFLIFTILNLLRVVGIISIGYWFGESSALTVHSFAGIVLIFVGIMLTLVLSEKLLKIKVMTKPQIIPPCSNCSPKANPVKTFCSKCGRYLNKTDSSNPKKTFALLLLLLLGSFAAVQAVQAPTFVTAKGQIELASTPNTQPTNMIPELPGYTLSFLYRDIQYEKISSQDMSLMYVYTPYNKSNFYVYADIGVSGNLNNLHNWEVCLVTYQTAQGQNPLVATLDNRDIQLSPETGIVAKYFAFDNPTGTRQVNLFWYEKASFKTGVTVEQKYVRISLIILTQKNASVAQAEEQLYAAAQPIAAKFEPLKNQALISMGIPAQQALLAAAIVFFTLTASAQYFDQQRRKANNSKIFNNFASPKEKIVLNTLQDLAKNRKDTTSNDIVTAVQENRKRTVNPKRVLAILRTLEQSGAIKRVIVSTGNAPRLVWKPS